MSGLALRLRVRASRTPYRRAGIAFGNLPLVLGLEHIGSGIDGMRALVAIVSDPVLKVQRSAVEGEDGDFVAMRPDEVAMLRDMLVGLEAGSDLAAVEYTASSYLRMLLGDTILRSPEGPDAKGGDAAASSPAADGKADGGTNAAPAVEPPPASDASTASGEQPRAGVDASEAAPAADADTAKQPENTQQSPVVDGTARPVPSAGDAASPAAAVSPAPATSQPKKGDAIPAGAKAPAAQKSRSSSGRKASAPASAGGAKA